MTSIPPSVAPSILARHYMPPESLPNYDLIISEDGKPVDGVFDEKQMRLLTSVLYESWQGPGEGRPFLANANVGLFYSFNEPPIVPDVMLSFDVAPIISPERYLKSYFLWEYGKPPDAAIVIVSGTDGGELTTKLPIYEKIGIPYYVVWDPYLHLGNKALYCFVRQGRKFADNGTWFPQIGLGVTVWHGVYEECDQMWLRWCNEQGTVIPTGAEKILQETKRAEQEKQRAEQEKQRAEQEKQRAEKLAEKLRALGIDPNQP